MSHLAWHEMDQQHAERRVIHSRHHLVPRRLAHPV